MAIIKQGRDLILDALKEKSCYKQKIFRNTVERFNDFKRIIQDIYVDLHDEMAKVDQTVEVSFQDKGSFEVELKVAGDILIFTMHTNVFTFDDNHFLHKNPYVQENPARSYCGMIQVYNFLADSFKYGRMNDIGYLIARIFINHEGHFFVEGKRQLGFLYNDFDNMIINDAYIKAIVESAIIYSVDFDLLVPPYQEVKEISVGQKIKEDGSIAIKTGKRLGFRFQADSDQIMG